MSLAATPRTSEIRNAPQTRVRSPTCLKACVLLQWFGEGLVSLGYDMKPWTPHILRPWLCVVWEASARCKCVIDSKIMAAPVRGPWRTHKQEDPTFWLQGIRQRRFQKLCLCSCAFGPYPSPSCITDPNRLSPFSELARNNSHRWLYIAALLGLPGPPAVYSCCYLCYSKACTRDLQVF